MQKTTPLPRDPVRPRNPLIAWFDMRRRSMSDVAFALNRLTGIGLAVYLFIHLVVLSQLLRGPAGWDAFVRLARSPLFLAMDIVLIFGILFHGLNGIRVALVGMGIGITSQRALLWVLSGIGLILLIAATWLLFQI